jgi:hypothetical protein
MQYRRNETASWRPLETERSGNDIYQSLMPGPGDYGLTFPSDSGTLPPASTRTGLRAHPLLVVLGLTILAMAGVIVAIRLAAARRQAA